MKGEVFFKDIRDIITKGIMVSSTHVKVAVAWFTDEDIMRVLIQAKKRGVEVEVVISDCQENFFNQRKLTGLFKSGVKLYVSKGKLMHHKFCIIDTYTILTGSYNWSYQAKQNEENITILYLDRDVREDVLMQKKYDAHYSYLRDKTSVEISDSILLRAFATNCHSHMVGLAMTDQKEIELRAQFEEDVKLSFEKSKAAKIPIGENLEARMVADGGGVEFVKRILRDEMATREMKSGFKRLTEVIPHRVDLSLEYLASRNKYRSLFSEEAVTFCNQLMMKYNLMDLS